MTQEEQIIESETRLLNAMKASDINALDELLHADLIFNIPNGQTITKSMDIENYQSGTMIVSEILVSDQVIKFFDNISTVTMTLHLKARYAEQEIDGKFKYLRVWKLFGNSWKVIAGSGFQI